MSRSVLARLVTKIVQKSSRKTYCSSATKRFENTLFVRRCQLPKFRQGIFARSFSTSSKFDSWRMLINVSYLELWCLTLLHRNRPKLHTALAVLSAKGFIYFSAQAVACLGSFTEWIWIFGIYNLRKLLWSFVPLHPPFLNNIAVIWCENIVCYILQRCLLKYDKNTFPVWSQQTITNKSFKRWKNK